MDKVSTYFWNARAKDQNIRNPAEVENCFEILLEDNESNSLNTACNNFIIAHIKAAIMHTPLKTKIRKCVPWETAKIEEKKKHKKLRLTKRIASYT